MSNIDKYIPSERLRVFISSAQSNEDGFAWSEVRRRIKDYLSQCIYLNPFIIEDVASPTSSTQFFQRQVEHADAIVLLVKGEVRKGTATEYALASKLKKPLFVYFLEVDNPSLDVAKLKKDIQTNDRCTYHPVSTFDNIEVNIRNEIMEDVIRTFQDKYFRAAVDETDTGFLPPENYAKGRILSKKDIAQFESLYDTLFDLLGIRGQKNRTEEQEQNSFGFKLLNWIVNGNYQLKDEEIATFITESAGLFSDKDWLYKRWDAIKYYHLGDLGRALDSEINALECAKNAKEPSWIIGNILIDCRNLEVEIGNRDRTFTFGKHQEELSSQEYLVCLPVLDRYLNEIYEQIDHDEFRVKTAPPNTELFGTGISSALKNYTNYVFAAALYGSLTHLMLARTILSQIMQSYAVITGNSEYAFIAIKELLLAGDVKNYKLYINSAWNEIYSAVTASADDLWKLTEQAPIVKRDSIKQTVIETLGQYFTDAVFAEAESFLLGFSDSVYWGNAERYFETILAVLFRMKPMLVLKSIIPIISDKRYSLGSKLSRILIHMDYSDVEKQTLIDLNDALTVRLPDIIRNNGNPQLITVLLKADNTVFKDLETLPGNGLEGIQELLFKINLGSENWLPVLQSEIRSARAQFEANSQKGVFHGFASNPYYLISEIVRDRDSDEKIDQLIIEEFIPLAIDVLNSEAAVPTKEACVACLCDVLNAFERHNTPLPSELVEAIKTVDVQKGSDFYLSVSRQSLEIRTIMAKVQGGVTDINGLLQWCFSFNKLTVREKTAVIDCIESYLYQIRNDQKKVDSLIVSIILQCVTEDDPGIRRIANRCAAYIVTGEYQEVATTMLDKAVFDPSDKVRGALINLYREKLLPADLSKRIIKTLANDASYTIRKRAEKSMKL